MVDTWQNPKTSAKTVKSFSYLFLPPTVVLNFLASFAFRRSLSQQTRPVAHYFLCFPASQAPAASRAMGFHLLSAAEML